MSKALRRVVVAAEEEEAAPLCRLCRGPRGRRGGYRQAPRREHAGPNMCFELAGLTAVLNLDRCGC